MLASTLVLMLLVVFGSVNVAVLVLRREPARSDAFVVPRILPVLGLLSCVALATQIEAATWRLGLPLLGVGIVLAAMATRHARLSRTGAQSDPSHRSAEPTTDSG